MKLMILLLFCHGASAVEHSLKIYHIISSGHPNIPDYVGITDFEDTGMTYYDSNMTMIEPRHDWVSKLMEGDPQHWKKKSQDCKNYEQVFKDEANSFNQHSKQTGGVYIVQQIFGCVWDDETQKADGFKEYAYNGEDILKFDLQTETWIAANPQAEITKHEWDGNTANNQFWKNFLTNFCPELVKKYLTYASAFLHRTDLPSVSLLQKSPSSPVSCHATGFYPDRALMLWRKDGEDLHEDVDQGEILPNHDGSFQMRVDLKLSSVKPEDWRRYDCVFQLSGADDKIITKLDKAEIRTNSGKPSDTTVPIFVAVVVLAVILISVIGFTVYKKKKERDSKELSRCSYQNCNIEPKCNCAQKSEAINNNETATLRFCKRD
ncbi:major histocompatibility complex class I-related gene protein-like [Trachinotus anak]|uniref:major histocompatibility complex class I-related gene protein-like n=1 Tax=Trachinotus anak TaxID=443729 RepID=UPI0039F19584